MNEKKRTYPAAGVMLMVLCLTLMFGQHFICFNKFLDQDLYYYVWVAALGLAQATVLLLVKGSPDWAYRYLCRFYIMAALIGIFMAVGVLKYIFIASDFFGAWYTGTRLESPKRPDDKEK